jgi:hypothetical protein
MKMWVRGEKFVGGWTCPMGVVYSLEKESAQEIFFCS